MPANPRQSPVIPGPEPVQLGVRTPCGPGITHVRVRSRRHRRVATRPRPGGLERAVAHRARRSSARGAARRRVRRCGPPGSQAADVPGSSRPTGGTRGGRSSGDGAGVAGQERRHRAEPGDEPGDPVGRARPPRATPAAPRCAPPTTLRRRPRRAPAGRRPARRPPRHALPQVPGEQPPVVIHARRLAVAQRGHPVGQGEAAHRQLRDPRCTARRPSRPPAAPGSPSARRGGRSRTPRPTRASAVSWSGEIASSLDGK